MSAYFLNRYIYSRALRLLRTFAGVLLCPLRKNSSTRQFKGKHGELYIAGKVNKCRFFKRIMNCQVFLIPQTKTAKMTAKMTMRHSIRYLDELIGYQKFGRFLTDVVKKPECVGGFLKLIIFHTWQSLMQCASRILCCST